jgi:hypothetical protein
MGSSATVRRSVVWCLLVGGVVTVAAQAVKPMRDRPRQSSSWGALEVLTFEPTKPTFLWVGVLNKEETRLVCILYRGIGLTERDGTTKLEGSGASPHACDAADQFHLVRGGQSLFTRLTLPKDLAQGFAGKIRVELSVVDRPLTGSPSRRDAVGLTWEGTLQEAADQGRALAAGAKQGR